MSRPQIRYNVGSALARPAPAAAAVAAATYTGFGTGAPSGAVGQPGDTTGYTMGTAFRVTGYGLYLRKIRVWLESAGGAITTANLTNSGTTPLKANLFLGNPAGDGAWREPLLPVDASLASPVPGAWNEFVVAVPYELEVGQTYYAAVAFPAGRYSSVTNKFAASALSVGPIVFPQDASGQANGTVRNGTFTTAGNGLSTSAPSSHFGSEWYCIDVEVGDVVQDGASLTLEPWHGGPSWWSQFPQAAAGGQVTSSSFYPLWIDYGRANNQGDIDPVIAAGINGFHRVISGSNFDLIRSNGLVAVPGYPIVVNGTMGNETIGWSVDDEVDMWAGPGWAAWTGNFPGQGEISSPPGQPAGYTVMAELSAALPADSRFRYMNYGKGVVFWEDVSAARVFVNGGADPGNPTKSFTINGGVSADLYFYSDNNTIDEATNWLGIPTGEIRRADNYGKYVVQRVRDLDGLSGQPRRPVFGFVELAPQGANVSPAQFTAAKLEGAVWSCIVYGAAGIIYFNSDFVYSGSQHVLEDNINGVAATVTALNAKIAALAPVLNTQSYVWSFAPTVKTMLKQQGGYWWIFAMSKRQAAHDAGSRTFRMPASLPQSGTVTVVNEARTISLSSGVFTDTFAAESTCHVYRIPV